MKFQKGHPKPEKAHKFPKGHKINFGKKNAFRNRIIKGNCVICRKEIQSFKSQPRKTCSKECHSRLISQRLKKNKYAFKTGIPYDMERKSEQYKKWRMKVFYRDGFRCQICRQIGVELNAHHIRYWRKYPELRFIIDNGITLCKKCHRLIHLYEKTTMGNQG